MLRPEVDLRLLRAFCVVADELHFGRAAERLGTAQPALSLQIKRLEAVVGFPLFARDTRKVILTEAGKDLVVVARRVIGEVADAVEHARQVGRGNAGTLSVGFTATTALQVLPTLVRKFREGHPHVQLGMTETLAEAIYDNMWARKFDLGLVREPVPDQNLEALAIMDEPFVAVFPSEHRLAHLKSPVRLADLADESFVLSSRDRSSCVYDKIMDVFREGGVRPRVAQEIWSWQTAVSLASAGVGIAVLPQCVSNLHQPGVCYRRVKSSVSTTVKLLWHKTDDRPVIQKFVEMALTVERQLRARRSLR